MKKMTIYDDRGNVVFLQYFDASFHWKLDPERPCVWRIAEIRVEEVELGKS